jgi:uncharacterized protein
MTHDSETKCVAFVAGTMLAFGSLHEVALAAKHAFDADTSVSPLVFEATTSARIDIDLGGNAADVLARLPMPQFPSARRPGRPKLGVVPREVTLLPRHWEWLSSQPGGASVALRKLVDQARKAGSQGDEQRKAQEAMYRFMTAIGGDYPGYEDATRALFANDRDKFFAQIEAWPIDVRTHLTFLADAAFLREANHG